MNIELLAHTPDPESVIALAARLCYSPSSIADLRQKLDSSGAELFLDKIMSLGHHSVLEHASFTFGIEGISRVTSHQMVRHRIASFSQQSQRYVSHKDEFASITPDSIKKNTEASQIFAFISETTHKAYAQLIDLGISPEDARYILPNAAETKLIVSMNARELLHFFSLRCCQRAQWEIREMAIEMLRCVIKIAPTIFGKGGPGCLRGACPEGAFSCGQADGVRKYFKNLT